jgi:DNA processing protein
VSGPERLGGLAAADRTAACLVALSYLRGLGPATVRRCHLEHGAEESWFDLVAGRPDRIVPVTDLAGRGRPDLPAQLVAEARRRDPAADLARQGDAGRRVHVFGSRGYPDRLVADPAAPAVLFSQGRLAALAGPTVAVVGTRNATLAGRQLAEELGEGLAAVEVSVISGLALGIDGAVHRGALRARGPCSVAVIASGLDVVYPRRHAHLHADLARHGLLVTETPAGVRPDPWRFPARNRIIAGLADAVVVVESRAAGGSLHTVDEALARDVPVLAVPGHPSAPASAGTNALIYDGAGLVRDIADVLLAIGVTPPPAARPPESAHPAPPLGPAERAVLHALGSTPSSLAELVAATGRTVGEVAHALTRLVEGRQVQESQGWYEAATPRTVAR